MASRHDVEVTIGSARDLKNVNWRHGDLKAYAVVWVDPAAKCSTKVDVDGDTNPVWDEKLIIPLPPGHSSVDDAVLYIDVVHAAGAADEGVKPLVGSARLPLREVVEEGGIGSKVSRTLKLKRPSGRPHGKLDVQVKVAAKDPPPASRYYDPYAVPYGAPAAASRDLPPYGGGYGQPYGASAPPSGYPYGAPPPSGYPYGAPQPAAGYGYGGPSQAAGYGYGAAPPQYGAPPPQYAAAPPQYGAQPYGQEGKKSKFGMGTGLAVGAAAGVLGGLALAEGVDYVEDKIADDVEDRVEDDLGYDDF